MLNRHDSRQAFFDAWRKHTQGEPLEPLEKQLVALIQAHPEYQDIFTQPEAALAYDFSSLDLAENPFLHLGLHLTLLDQIATNRPKGITAIYKDMVATMGDAHHAEHHIMEILADIIWTMVQTNAPADEKAYLKQLKKLLKKGCHHH